MDKGMERDRGLDQLDFRLVLAFTNAYERLYEKGEITEKQFNQILVLLENFQQYSLEEFKEALNKIFPGFTKTGPG